MCIIFFLLYCYILLDQQQNETQNSLFSFSFLIQEFREELEEHDKHLKNAHEVALGRILTTDFFLTKDLVRFKIFFYLQIMVLGAVRLILSPGTQLGNTGARAPFYHRRRGGAQGGHTFLDKQEENEKKETKKKKRRKKRGENLHKI